MFVLYRFPQVSVAKISVFYFYMFTPFRNTAAAHNTTPMFVTLKWASLCWKIKKNYKFCMYLGMCVYRKNNKFNIVIVYFTFFFILYITSVVWTKKIFIYSHEENDIIIFSLYKTCMNKQIFVKYALLPTDLIYAHVHMHIVVFSPNIILT